MTDEKRSQRKGVIPMRDLIRRVAREGTQAILPEGLELVALSEDFGDGLGEGLEEDIESDAGNEAQG